MEKIFKFNVKWDFDSIEEKIPSKFKAKVEIPDDIETEDELVDFLSDWLSNEYGYCHNGFTYDEVK